ncbi:focadhesin [Lutzomyia longipalpis]|uniref:focadhesin n=1 Tax=Lutzomyia longipalpis TaxID=7200 RepID=UPI00248427C5|nr:focadhesin [Lutzomyia longipalpis]
MSQKSDLAQVNALQSTTKIAAWLAKLYRTIKEKKSSKQSTDNEEKTLMSACVSENYTVGLLGCHILAKAAEEDTLSVPQVRTVLLSLLPNAEGARFAAISGALCEVAVTEFRKQCKSAQGKYTCPYGLQHPEHPFIAILNAKKGHGQEIAVIVKELFNHQDKDICNASTEFLRPVFLYVVKNIEIIPSARTLWSLLIQQSVKSDHGSDLFFDCLMWVSCQNSTLLTNILLNDALEAMAPKKKPKNTLKVLLKLLVSLLNQLKLGLDPRMSFSLIMRALQSDLNTNNLPHGLILLICIDLLDDIPPIYVGDLLTVVRHLVLNCPLRSFLIHRMLLDSLILWSVEETTISDGAKQDIKLLKEHVEKQKVLEKDYIFNSLDVSLEDRMVGLYVDIEGIRSYLDEMLNDIELIGLGVLEELVAIKEPTIRRLLCKMMKGMLLSHDVVPVERLAKITPFLSKILQGNEDMALKFLTTFQYEIERVNGSLLKLELLRGVIECGHHRSNIQAILTLLRNFGEKNKDFEGDVLKLYLRLWQIDGRTYQYLYDQISQGRRNSSRQVNLVRVEVIKTICEKSPTQHGADLVAHLSDVLNQSSSPTDDGAVICIVMETIILLCESHTVSIVGIWKALGFAFRYEKRPKVLMSLCKFFGEFPKYTNATPEYNNMAKEIYQRLWTYALTSKFPEVQKEAFEALGMFPLDMITLKEIPEQFRENLKLPKSKLGPDVDVLDTLTYIPGECWLQLLMKVDNASKDFAGDLIAAHIRREIQEYRGSVYNVPPGKGEPEDLSYLPPKSILKPIVKFIHQQAAVRSHEASDDFHLIHCMRILSKKFPKPIPPVNWSCLHEVFHRRREIRQYCVSVAISQSVISGTAKRFLCNYLEKFTPSFVGEDCDEDVEITAAFDKLPTLLNTVDPLLVRKYIKRCFKSNYETTYPAFERFLGAKMKEIADDLTEQHLALLVEPILDALEACRAELNESVTEVFCDIFRPFKRKHLSFWVDFASRQHEAFKRSICWKLAQDFKDIKMLDPIIKHISDPTSGYDGSTQWENVVDLVCDMRPLFEAFKDNPEKCLNWCLDLLADMQFSMEHGLLHDFQCYADVFIRAITLISGYDVIQYEIYDDGTRSNYEAFPHALLVLSEMKDWKDQCGQIFDFLYEFLNNDLIHEKDFCDWKIFKKAIIYSKDLPYFSNKATWAKIMMKIKCL